MAVAHLPRPFAQRPGWRRVVRAAPQRRRAAITWTKRLLPVGALGLLAAIALWPELDRATDQERVTLRRLASPAAGAARMLAPRYRSVDQHGRPFVITAETGTQVGPDQVDMVSPKADASAGAADWLIAQATRGIFLQHTGLLDMAGDATLYRSDGTTLVSDTATVDTRAGVASSHDRTHAEGPFGTLDAQGFALLDKGDVIQFAGPARLVLNGHVATPAKPAP